MYVLDFKKPFVLAAIAGTLTLAACSTSATPPITSMPPPVDCGATALSGMAGQPVTGTTSQDVRVGGQPVQSQGSVRVISPGMAVTQDYREDRLNLEVSAARTLVRAYCS